MDSIKINKMLFKKTELFSWLIAFAPWLSIYATFIPGISVADFFLMLFVIYSLLFNFNKMKIRVNYIWIIIFIIYLILSTFIASINLNSMYYGNIFTRFIKFIFYSYIIIILFPLFLNKEELFKGIRFLVIFSCIVILIQYIAYYLIGVYLEFKIPFFSYANEVTESVNFAKIQMLSFRPSSIFLEPSHFSVFSILYLGILLFQSNENITIWIESILVSIAILLSVSSSALILIVFYWAIYIVKSMLKWKSLYTPFKVFLFFVIVFAILFPIFRNSPHLYQALERILDLNSAAVTGRINAGQNLVDSLEGMNKLFGVGFGNLPKYIYFNSIFYLLYCSGYVGIILFLCVLFSLFKSTRLLGKITILTIIMLSFSSPIVISINFVTYLSLVYTSSSG